MGNAWAKVAGSAGVRRQLPRAVNQDELTLINKIAAQEQQRMQDLPSYEELNRKDVGLDQFLGKLHGGITGTQVNITGRASLHQDPQQPPHLIPRGQTAVRLSSKQRTPIPDYIPSGLTRPQLEQMQGITPAQDDEPGRVQAFVLRDVLEAKNAAEAGGDPGPLAAATAASGVDEAKLALLHAHCALPATAKVKTFGHEYAFARPPAWWHSSSQGAIYKSEAAVLQASAERQSLPRQLQRGGTGGPSPAGASSTPGVQDRPPAPAAGALPKATSG